MDINSILGHADETYNKKYIEEVPMDGINPRIIKYVRQTAGILRVPTNYVFGEVTTLTGSAIGRKITIIDGAKKNRGNLYSAIVGGASDGKSPSINYAMKPLNRWENERYEKYSRQRHAAKQVDEELPPYSDQLIVSNETIENLYRVINNVKGCSDGLTMHQDELLNFFGGNSKKYSDGNIISDFLTLFDSFSPLRVGRVTLEERINVPEPFLSILGGIQKKRVDELFLGQDHNGFFSRWLFWLGNSESNLITAQDEKIDQYWEELIERAVSPDFNQTVLRFENEDMLNEIDNGYRSARDLLVDLGEDNLAETIMKQSYIIRRLAGIFHCMNALADGYIPNGLIKEETVEYASKVVEHLFSNSCVIDRVIEEKRIQKITAKQAIIAINNHYGIKNKQMFSDSLGGSPSRQYISRLLNTLQKE
jgi:hypothetical protein